MFLRLNSILKYAFMLVMVNDTINHIRATLKRPGYTKTGLAKLAGLHPNTLLGVDDDNWNPTAATLKAVEPHLPPLEGRAS
jgi:3,4-dihydroxy 2-butanone 4-phosphate synthase/GTP cyclohydrolase II